MRLPVLGGPQDGGEVAEAPGPYRWISDRGGHSKPGPGRALYVRRRHPNRWEYVGPRARICSDCGGVFTDEGSEILAAECHLCGAETVTANMKGK